MLVFDNQSRLHKINKLLMCTFSIRHSLAILLTLLFLATGCVANDLDKYRENGLLPRETSTIAEVGRKAKAATKKRDEESLGEALDELANFLITTSPIWFP